LSIPLQTFFVLVVYVADSVASTVGPGVAAAVVTGGLVDAEAGGADPESLPLLHAETARSAPTVAEMIMRRMEGDPYKVRRRAGAHFSVQLSDRSSQLISGQSARPTRQHSSVADSTFL
jgi:hypothetical protein